MAKSELVKHAETFEDRVVLGNFLAWLGDEGIRLCEHYDPEVPHLWQPIRQTCPQLLDKYLGIDPVQLEKERRELIKQG
jgi:hypothetical protein